ncbi:hypothetical protein GLYMA_12G114050v4 [Glycine max]|nr:hypothetical protein GLYMA_12G114050v4 [Glycine max]KAH1142698.1 hypothetical protein GYH30_033415 [Glycine max]
MVVIPLFLNLLFYRPTVTLDAPTVKKSDVAYQKLDDLKKMPFYLSEILP